VSSAHGWVDLLDPSEEEIRRDAPAELHARALEELTRPANLTQPARPTIEGHGGYVFGVLLAPVAVPDEDRLYAQEIAFVLTRDRFLTVRKTPPGEKPFDNDVLRAVTMMRERLAPGMLAYHLVDDIAERYLDLLDTLDEEAEELEDRVETWPSSEVQRRLSELRRDVIQIRRTLGPTRDAVRGVVDGRTDLEGRPLFRREVFPRDVELHFAQAYDKLLRANEGLDFSRDLVASVRDYHQSLVATEQNRVTKTLTVIASLLLFPTFIVGVYGQNFDNMPELHWRLGYAFSWALIAVVTLAQLAFFRWRRWI
jgi:magnesium transporter